MMETVHSQLAFDYVNEKAQGQVQELICLVELKQVDFCTVFGCCIKLLVTVSVSKPHNLVGNEQQQNITKCSYSGHNGGGKKNKTELHGRINASPGRSVFTYLQAIFHFYCAREKA